jgi:tyrosyl-tRNA synthetase
MLAAECFKTRFDSDSGLSFLEFNYMLLQAYDFLVLYRKHGCRLQLGGSDQWGNIVAGMELIRRVDGEEVHGVTFPLIQTADGRKMGKTESGAVWLDPERTSPYDFYQFWINTDDRDVGRFLRLFTFLDLDAVAELEALQGAELRRAKEVLAYEATRITHGDEEAERARKAARALFGGGDAAQIDAIEMPSFSVPRVRLDSGIPAIELCVEGKLCASRNEARRLARQGGLYVNGRAVPEDYLVRPADVESGAALLRAGKKRYLRVVLEGA